jgi:hypothetical protein
MFQRALEIQAARASVEWEPKGRRIEYITIEIALMRELSGSVWGVSVLAVDEHANGPPAWLGTRGKSPHGSTPFTCGVLCWM